MVTGRLKVKTIAARRAHSQDTLRRSIYELRRTFSATLTIRRNQLCTNNIWVLL